MNMNYEEMLEQTQTDFTAVAKACHETDLFEFEGASAVEQTGAIRYEGLTFKSWLGKPGTEYFYAPGERAKSAVLHPCGLLAVDSADGDWTYWLLSLAGEEAKFIG
jgi:hypothetical protein